MSKNIAEYVKTIYNEKAAPNDPATKTDLANSLDLLSSGIYTEEERFIFELLQNAVDAFEDDKEELRIKIVVEDNLVIFMHNGSEFTIRDVEGICSVGNGEKSSNIKKIGYKGIGFKSVFMHSDYVTIKSGDTIFSFNKSHWNNFFKSGGQSQTGRIYKMPWQIIPLLEDNLPSDIETSGYNVVTYLRIKNTKSIASKVKNLMGDCQFLLFLKHNNIKIDYIINTDSYSISKHSKLLRKIAPSKVEQEVSLEADGKTKSRWLVYQNENVSIDKEHANLIRTDAKIPKKLQDAQSYDLSFAINIDDEENFVPLKRPVLYTYLPTSCHVDIPFIVNANFVTDAGRQQLNVDTIWNHMVVSDIPKEFFRWISSLSKTHKDYYKILPDKSLGIPGLEEPYQSNLKEALEEIAFVPDLSNEKLLLVGETLYDEIGLKDGLSETRYNSYIVSQFGEGFSIDSLVDPKAGKVLDKYGSHAINKQMLFGLLENAKKNLKGFSINECVKFCLWLYNISKNESALAEGLGVYPFMIDENNELAAPQELFFPSDYRDENSIAQNAKVLSGDLMERLDQEGLIDWLASMGVQEMSNLSVIKNVICSSSFFNDITKEMAIEAIRFIFDSEQNESILDNLYDEDIRNLKFLTQKGNMEQASSLYLTFQDYGIGIEKNFDENLDAFISNKYIREDDDKLEWSIFFKKLGVNDKFELVKKKYESGDEIYEHFSPWIDYATKHEYNVSWWTGGTYYFSKYGATLNVKTIPLLSMKNNSHKVSKMVWREVLASPILLKRDDDYLRGSTGCGYYARGYLKDKTSDHNYLGENFLPYALKHFNWLPGSDGKLYRVTELLDNSSSNQELCGKYFPTLDVDCHIDDSWHEYLPFKQKLTINDYLLILEKIQKDSKDGVSKVNQDRISLIYSCIANEVLISEGSADYETLSKWGKTHKILSSEHSFKSPCELLLVSDDLGSIAIDNQVFRGKHIGNRNNRFVKLMKALGVKFVDNFTPNFDGQQKEDTSIKEKLKAISGFLTLLSIGKESTQDVYDSELKKIEKTINSFSFFKNDKISLSYAGKSVDKKVYVADNEFHYSGKFSLSILELMHDAIAERLNISEANGTTMITIIQMGSVEEIREYLTEKGFDTSVIADNPNLPSPIGSSGIAVDSGLVATFDGESYLSEEERRQYNEDARMAALQCLKEDGFDVSNAAHDYSRIHGVKKDGVEFPLVVKSHLGSHVFNLDSREWRQLMKKNSMLLVHHGGGRIRCVSFFNLLGNQDRMHFHFSPEALGNLDNLSKFFEMLEFFKDCAFDFSNLITTRYESLRNYQIGQNNPNAFIDYSPDDKAILD